MKKKMIVSAFFIIILLIVSIVLYAVFSLSVFYAVSITCGTIAYHLLMRLGIGYLFDFFMKNRADYSKKWYQCRKWENKLYKKLKVKNWKSHAPTFEPSLFNPKQHSWEEIAQAMCQAELVHETIVVLSFVPIIPSVLVFGDLPVFIITSLAAAIIDVTFVIIQRYNRPRIIRHIK